MELSWRIYQFDAQGNPYEAKIEAAWLVSNEVKVESSKQTISGWEVLFSGDSCVIKRHKSGILQLWVPAYL